MTMDGLLYDLTEKQIYHIGKQVLLALVRLGKMTTGGRDSSVCPVPGI